MCSYIRNLLINSPKFPTTKLTGLWQALINFSPDYLDFEAIRENFLEVMSLSPKRGREPAKPCSEDRGNRFEEMMHRCMCDFDPAYERDLFRCRSGCFGIGPAGRSGIRASTVQCCDCIAMIPIETRQGILRPVEDGLHTLVAVAIVTYPLVPP